MNKKLKDTIEELEWFIVKEGSYWALTKFTPHGIDFGIMVSNSEFLDAISNFIDNFKVDHFVNNYQYEEVEDNHFITRPIEEVVDDAKWAKNEVIELYNAIKDLEVFNGDARKESKEEAN